MDMGFERIVSLLPSATELLYELGEEDKIYGVTHECLYPKSAKSKPRIINSVFDSENMSSKQIDETTSTLLKQGKEIFVLNENNLIKANPDLIISQQTCEVCAAYTNHVEQALRVLKNLPKVLSLDPHNVEDILNSIIDVSKLIGKEKEGEDLRYYLQKRIDFIKNQNFEKRPKVLAIEWIEPFFTAGHWVPEMIEIAGGKNQIGKIGEHSRRMTLDEAIKSEPEIIIIMPCGFDARRTISEYQNFLLKNKIWSELDAVLNNKVYAVDANSFFSKPSIRTITGIEILAKIIHPNVFKKLSVPDNSFEQIRTVS